MPEPLASTADLAAYLGHDVDDQAAGTVVAGVSGLVRNYCGWHLAPTEVDVDLTVDGSGGRVQPLPTRHLTAVSAVTENDVDLDPAAVHWSQAGYLYRGTPFTTRLQGVTVTVSHGFTEVPPEVVMVVLSVAARGVDNPTGLTQYTIGGVNASYGSSAVGGAMLQPLERFVLDRYRVVQVA